MTNVSNVQAFVGVLPDEVSSQKRCWLQVFHPPIEQVAAPQIQEAVNPKSAVADFTRQHSASGYPVVYSVPLQPLYSTPEADLSVLLGVPCQDANNADINRVQGAEDVCFYSTQTMTTNYADMCVQVVENDICRATVEAVCFDCRTYLRPYKITMLTQPPYSFESQQITAALMAMETHPDYADTHTVKLSNVEPYLFSECFMNYGKACGLCGWLEVEQYQNP